MCGILFDLDGTLVDTIPLWVHANVQALAERDCSIDGMVFLQEYYNKGLHHSGILEKSGLSTDHADAFYSRRNDLFVDELRTKAEWMDGAQSVLQYCKDQGVVGLMTGSRNRYIQALNERLRLSSYFQGVITFDETGNQMKPSPYGLQLLTNTLNLQPSHCVYIGDQPVDIEAAKNAGMKSIFIPQATTASTELRPDLLLESLRELPTALTQLLP